MRLSACQCSGHELRSQRRSQDECNIWGLSTACGSFKTQHHNCLQPARSTSALVLVRWQGERWDACRRSSYGSVPGLVWTFSISSMWSLAQATWPVRVGTCGWLCECAREAAVWTAHPLPPAWLHETTGGCSFSDPRRQGQGEAV